MSLYRHFESKSSLILAVLDERQDTWVRWFIEEVEVRLADGTRLSVFADVLRIWFDTDSSRLHLHQRGGGVRSLRRCPVGTKSNGPQGGLA